MDAPLRPPETHKRSELVVDKKVRKPISNYTDPNIPLIIGKNHNYNKNASCNHLNLKILIQSERLFHQFEMG